MNILIVDDDKSTLTMLRILLSEEDRHITTVLDATEALKVLSESEFDWLVVDGQIHPIDGFKLAARARAIRPELRTVMISGIFHPKDIAGHPIRKLFPKPVDTDALSSYLRQPNT